MKLSIYGLNEREAFSKAGYHLPDYDIKAVSKKTHDFPMWVHFGAGNIFRAFHAELAEKLLEKKCISTGITVCEGYDYEIIEKMYRPHDNLSVLVELKADGKIDKSVIGSIGESVILDSDDQTEFGRMKEIFKADSLQLCTFTVTEKGYSLVDGRNVLLKAVAEDFENGPDKPLSYIGKVAALLYTRYCAGKKKIAMVSTDNCSHNGEKLHDSVLTYAEKWAENKLVDNEFVDYLNDENYVSFPWTMIDKITPRPDESVEKILINDGFADSEPVVTSKNTWVAPFVNAEETEYLVIEDKFPNGRPSLEKAGVIFTDRDTVNKVERMKVTTCLNPLHTALAVYGCLLGFTRISEEMKDSDLVEMVNILGYKEGLPVVVDPGVLDPKKFIDTVINVRIPNPFMPDTPQRIATDTSQKLAIRFGETIKAYMSASDKDTSELNIIPLVLAGWLRYLMAVDDNGRAFQPSPDPFLESAGNYVKGFKLGEVPDSAKALERLLPLLKNKQIFGVDLEEAGLAERVVNLFCRELSGAGAVRETLHCSVRIQ